MPYGNGGSTALTHGTELEMPSWSDLDRSFLLQSISCQVLASPCHSGSEHSDRPSPADFAKHGSKPLSPITPDAISRH